MLDEQFTALSNEHRRRLLLALLEQNPQNEVTVPEDIHVGERELTHLRNNMFHSHLPQLAETGFIEWDRDAHQVTRGPRFEEIRPLLELIDAHADELPAEWP